MRPWKLRDNFKEIERFVRIIKDAVWKILLKNFGVLGTGAYPVVRMKDLDKSFKSF